jgi:hypothetical protein
MQDKDPSSGCPEGPYKYATKLSRFVDSFNSTDPEGPQRGSRQSACSAENFTNALSFIEDYVEEIANSAISVPLKTFKIHIGGIAFEERIQQVALKSYDDNNDPIVRVLKEGVDYTFNEAHVMNFSDHIIEMMGNGGLIVVNVLTLEIEGS